MEPWKRAKLGVLVIFFEIIFLILFGVFVHYDDMGMPTFPTSSPSQTATSNITGQDVTASAASAEHDVPLSAMAHITKYYASMYIF